jgi:hypothetical protein
VTLTDRGAVEDDRTVADQGLLSDDAVVHQALVADRDVAADLADTVADVDDRVVLDVRALADDDPAEIGADHHAVPDRGALLDGHVADQGGGRRDPGFRMDGGADALKRKQRHARHARSAHRSHLSDQYGAQQGDGGSQTVENGIAA